MAKSKPILTFFLLALLFTGAGAWALSQVISWLIAFGISINAVTFLFYGYDKWVSGTKKTRIPELVLHSVAGFGGTPLAFVGQSVFRHKTSKTSFRRTFWCIVFLQVAGLAYFLWSTS